MWATTKYVSFNCQSTGTEPVMKPLTPPMTKRMIVLAKKRKAVVITGRPVQMVAVQAKIATALGMTMMSETPLKNDSARVGNPVANM